MVEAGILDGDYVVVRRQDDSTDGEIVAALVDGTEATVKRLAASAAACASPRERRPGAVLPRRVDVLGQVVGVFRRL